MVRGSASARKSSNRGQAGAEKSAGQAEVARQIQGFFGGLTGEVQGIKDDFDKFEEASAEYGVRIDRLEEFRAEMLVTMDGLVERLERSREDNTWLKECVAKLQVTVDGLMERLSRKAQVAVFPVGASLQTPSGHDASIAALRR